MPFPALEDLLDEPPESFPSRSSVKILRGKTLTRIGKWHKAAVLVDSGGKKQLRLYGWRKSKEGIWKVIQKFNVSRGYAARVGAILDAFAIGE